MTNQPTATIREIGSALWVIALLHPCLKMTMWLASQRPYDESWNENILLFVYWRAAYWLSAVALSVSKLQNFRGAFCIQVRVKINKVSSRIREPLTQRHLSPIWLDEPESSRVRPQRETCVQRTWGLAAPLASQHSTVCATIPNEAVHCRGSEVLSMGIYVGSLTTTEGGGGEAINLLSLEHTKENRWEEKKQHCVIHHA